MQNSKEKTPIPGVLPNFDILLQQQLSQSAKEGGGGKAGLLNWEALAQMQLQGGQNSKESLKNLAPGMPNLDLLLQLQLSKDSSTGKNFPGWDALSLAQMQLAQSQLGKDNQTKHGSGLTNLDVLTQLQSFKDKGTKAPHGLPNFEALALAQLQLSQGVKDSKSVSNIPNFDSQLKDSYAKMSGLAGIPNFEALMQLQVGKGNKDQSKNLEALMGSSKEGKPPPVPGFDVKDKIPGFEALAQLQLGVQQKDGKNPFPGLNFEALSQFQMGQKDCGKSSVPSFPNFEALALAQLQLSQGKEKGAFGGVPNFEALAKFQMGSNPKEGLKNLIPGYEAALQGGQNSKDAQSKSNDWEGEAGSKEKK